MAETETPGRLTGLRGGGDIEIRLGDRVDLGTRSPLWARVVGTTFTFKTLMVCQGEGTIEFFVVDRSDMEWTGTEGAGNTWRVGK